MELSINLVNEIRIYRDDTFVDLTTYVEELSQNADRAGCDNLWWEVDDDRIVAANDGALLEDLTKLFTISESGWNEAIKEKQHPFGKGFMSVIIAADTIEVHSAYQKAVFDVRTVLDKGELDCIEVEDSDEYYQGFKVTLTDLLPTFDKRRTMRKIREVGQWLDFNVYLNDDRIEAIVFNELPDRQPYAMLTPDHGIDGWVAPSTHNFYKPVVHYQRREVCKIDMPYLTGRLNVDSRWIDPRQPDRKAIIMNKKAEEFFETIQSYAKTVFLDLVERGSQKTLEKYERGVMNYCTPGDYAKHLKFIVLSTADIAEYRDALDVVFEGDTSKITDALNRIIAGERSIEQYLVDRIRVIDEAPKEEHEWDQLREEKEELQERLETLESKREMEALRKGQEPEGGSTGTTTTTTTTTGTGSGSGGGDADGEKKGTDFYRVSDLPTLYYLSVKDFSKYQTKLAEAEYLGVNVVFCRNKLEIAAVEAMQNSVHIKNLKKGVTKRVIMERIGPTDANEVRFQWLLDLIMKKLREERAVSQTITMADIKYIEIHRAMKSHHRTEKVKPVNGIAHQGKVYLNRSRLKLVQYDGVAFDKRTRALTQIDINVLLDNIDVVAHELAHILYHTRDNTMKHYQVEVELIKRIVEAITDVKRKTFIVTVDGEGQKERGMHGGVRVPHIPTAAVSDLVDQTDHPLVVVDLTRVAGVEPLPPPSEVPESVSFDEEIE